MSSSMLFAMMTAAGSRADGAGIGRDFGVLAIACLDGFPTINSPIWKTRLARPAQPTASQAQVFNFDNNIGNCIVNNIGWGYHRKKRADSSLYRDRTGGNGMKKDRKDS